MQFVYILQGVEFAVFLHESRALTEGKEKDGKVLVIQSTTINNSWQTAYLWIHGTKVTIVFLIQM